MHCTNTARIAKIVIMIIYLHIWAELAVITDGNRLMANDHVVAVNGGVIANDAFRPVTNPDLRSIAHFKPLPDY